MFEREIRDLQFIPRWSLVRRIRDSNVVEHSFFVAVYAEQIATHFKWEGSMGDLLRYALWHDMKETIIGGDLAGPTKRRIIDQLKYDEVIEEEMPKRFPGGEWREPGNMLDILAIVKVADLLDEWYWLLGEDQMGNKTLSHSIRLNTQLRLSAAIGALPFPKTELAKFEEEVRKSLYVNHGANSRVLVDPQT